MKKISILTIIIAIVLCGCEFNSNKNDGDIKENDLIDVSITLYFGDSQAMYVVPEKRNIRVNKDISNEEYAKIILDELIKGPVDENKNPTIPAEVKVLNVEIKEDLLYVDFSNEMHTKHWRGAAGESMTLLSLANTMTEIDGIKRVLPSVEGAALSIEHVIVEEPLIRDEGMIFIP